MRRAQARMRAQRLVLRVAACQDWCVGSSQSTQGMQDGHAGAICLAPCTHRPHLPACPLSHLLCTPPHPGVTPQVTRDTTFVLVNAPDVVVDATDIVKGFKWGA